MKNAHLTCTQLSNLKTRFWNAAYREKYVPVIDAGGTKRAAEKARVAYLETMGCKQIKMGRSVMVVWNEEVLRNAAPEQIQTAHWSTVDA